MSRKKTREPDPSGVHALAGDSLFSKVFEKIQTGIIILDAETHTIVDANPLAEKILGFTRDQLMGRCCQEFICPSAVGRCPITDLKKEIDDLEKEMITAGGKRIPVLKTVVAAEFAGKKYLIESFTDFSDHMRAENHRVILIAYLSESIHRVRRPLELTAMNLRAIAEQVTAGEFEPEEIRMQLQIQVNNIEKMIQTLEDLSRSVTEEQPEIPKEFREFLAGK